MTFLWFSIFAVTPPSPSPSPPSLPLPIPQSHLQKCYCMDQVLSLSCIYIYKRANKKNCPRKKPCWPCLLPPCSSSWATDRRVHLAWWQRMLSGYQALLKLIINCDITSSQMFLQWLQEVSQISRLWQVGDCTLLCRRLRVCKWSIVRAQSI